MYNYDYTILQKGDEEINEWEGKEKQNLPTLEGEQETRHPEG